MFICLFVGWFISLFVCLDYLDSFNCDPPGLSGLPQQVLHLVGDGLALGEDVAQLLGAKHVPEKRNIIVENISNVQNIHHSTYHTEKIETKFTKKL